ncbi:MAG TPA: hypothetical protein VGI88_05955 [Verrucomicrobiae bacterium]|jgi:hypothetical protein
MKTKHIVQFAFGLLLIALTNGCVTKGLWENGNLEAWNQPAANPNLRLFEAKPSGDLLVVYDEYAERHDVTRTRAFWLNENEKLLAERHMPHFSGTNSTAGFASVPVFLTGTNQSSFPPPPYAIVDMTGRSFTLYLNDGATVSYDLPYYNDGQGKVEKFVLTPLAIAGDATVVGALIGYAYIAGESSGYNPSY